MPTLLFLPFFSEERALDLYATGFHFPSFHVLKRTASILNDDASAGNVVSLFRSYRAKTGADES